MMIAAIAILLLDQITKSIFADRDFFLGSVHIHLVKNYGLPFGLNFSPVLNLLIIGAAFLIFCYYFFIFQKDQKHLVPFILIIAAALSNIVDRLQFGYVRDFVDLGLGFTFNLADLFIIIGLLLFTMVKKSNSFRIKP